MTDSRSKSLSRIRSFPERLSDIKQREYEEGMEELRVNIDSLQQFRKKDQNRAEEFARMGSMSSISLLPKKSNFDNCCNLIIRWGNFLLERGEEERMKDKRIQQKSYASFYFFIKWFIRSMFLMIFTTLGSIIGKEIGCEIKSHKTCDLTAIDLAGNSPHIIATVLGFFFGLITGQWLGRLIWDTCVKYILICLRTIEKKADESKIFLIALSIFVYIIGITSSSIIFFFFVHIGGDNNIIGALIGGIIGLICAIIAFSRNSPCQSGQKTPMHKGIIQTVDPPEMIL